jgi:hypothetical protein
MKSAMAFLRRAPAAAAILLASLSLSGCGGGAAALFAGGGIGGTGFSTGAIIAFGSVTVNGVKFETNDNTVRRRLDVSPDNIQGLDNEVFRVGMVVRIHHEAGDNTALRIDFQDDLEGPVADLNSGAGTFTVLGQPVAFDNATNFLYDPGATLVENAIVEISGLYDADGLLHATFIEVEPPGSKTEFEIKGYVSNLTASTFTIGPMPGAGTITVDYATLPAQQKDLPLGLANGLFVEVKTASTAGTLVATSVEGEIDVADDAPDEGDADIEGYVSDLAGSSPDFTFLLNGMSVRTNAATEGLQFVLPNGHVEAEGAVSNGILTADSIKSR